MLTSQNVYASCGHRDMATSPAKHRSVLDWAAMKYPIDLETICTKIGQVIGVEQNCVGVLKVRGLTLEFVYPLELKSAGRIPLSSSAVAARCVITRVPEIFNNFARTAHNSVFELLPLGGAITNTGDPQRIQKLMSAPVLDDDRRVVAVIQVSRKGTTCGAAGPDFTDADLQMLLELSQHLAGVIAAL